MTETTETKSAFARRLNCSRPWVAKLIARGMPVKDDGRVPVKRALRHLRDHDKMPRSARADADPALEQALSEEVDRVFGRRDDG